MKTKDARLKPLSFSKKTFSIKIYIDDKYDNNKQIRALMPNVVHSLDASSLCMLIDKYFNSYNSKYKNIYAIHDCFAVTANNVTYLLDTLKVVYITIYSENSFLHVLNKAIIDNIKLHCGEESFDDEKLLIYIKNTKKPISYPNISEVIKGDFNIHSLKESSYIVT
jgi:DNA-directed RNA polymerase